MDGGKENYGWMDKWMNRWWEEGREDDRWSQGG